MKTKRVLILVVALLLFISASRSRTQAQGLTKKSSQLVTLASGSPVTGSGTVGHISKWAGVSGTNTYTLGDSNIFEDKFGKVGIGTTAPTSLLTVQGMIEITLGGLKFPDGTVQASAALASVFHDITLTGNGTFSSPLGVAVPLSLTGIVPTDAIIEGNNMSSDIRAIGVRGISSSGSSAGVVGLNSSSGIGVRGIIGDGVPSVSTNSVGVYGESATGLGVFGASDSSIGVSGLSSSASGVVGSSNSGPGVFGVSNSNDGVEGRSSSRVGVEGISTTGAGVRGESTSSTGVQGVSSTGRCVVATSVGTGDLFGGVSGGSERFRVDNDGDVFAKSYMPISDARLKTNIERLTDTLDKLQQIRAVSFQWTSVNSSPASREIGVIAQEVEPIFPELVKPWGGPGYKGVSYDGLTAVLLEGVKSLKVENDRLKAKTEALGTRLDVLEQTIKELKQAIGK